MIRIRNFINIYSCKSYYYFINEFNNHNLVIRRLKRIKRFKLYESRYRNYKRYDITHIVKKIIMKLKT